MSASALSIYIPSDRRRALARGASLPARTSGAALFADISGFTPLTEALARTLGPRRGAEELTRQLNRVYDALIDEVDRFGGSVIGFSGDAILCWFDDQDSAGPLRALTCALAMQGAMRPFAAISLPNGEHTALAMKAAVATGPARRFLVGDPDIHLVDTIAGAPVSRTADAEHLAGKGEVLADPATVETLQASAALGITEWRSSPETGERYAVVTGLALPASDAPAAGVLAAVTDAQARPWLLPAVYERLSDGLGEFLTELRPAIALFMRFGGIDYETDDAERQLDAFVRWVQTVLARYDGSLLQLTIGDKGSYLYAAFGAPLAHEDDAQRAARAAIELRTPPPELSCIDHVQIGLSQGTMRAGAYGGMTRRTYGVLGDDVNLAARLMQNAPPGEVLVSERVRAQIVHAFLLEALPPLRVKGKREPVPIARLASVQNEHLMPAFYSGALVGRDDELARLVDGLTPILSGRFAGLVAVHGEAGMGKSRLVYEARHRLGLEGRVRWLTCLAEGILRQPLGPFRYFLRQYFDQRADSADDENKARFDEALRALLAALARLEGEPPAALAAELERTRSFLGALAGGLRWEGSLYEQVEPRLRLENTFTAFKSLVLAESLLQPVVVYVEDAHWLDADSEQLLRALTRNVEDYAFAVLLASRYRDDGSRVTVDVDAETPQQAIDLAALKPAGVRAMAAQTLGGDLADDVAELLSRRTSGNPYFVEQLALDLRERGLIAAPAEGGPVRFVDRARVEDVPDSINGLLVARLDRLMAQVRAVVQTAAVLGQEFEVAVLSRMLREDEQVTARVRQAESDAIWAALNETRFLFRSALLRDAAYHMQLHTRLRELHALAGAALETVYAEDLASHAALLAYHWAAAGDPRRELRYSALAGEQATRLSAYREALRHYRRALDLLEADPGLAGGLSPARLYYGLAEAHAGLGQVRESREWLHQSLALARAGGDAKATVDALSQLGGTDFHLGEPEQAVGHLLEALELAQAIGDRAGVSITLSRLGRVARSRGDYAGAARYYEQALDIARALGDRVRMADVLNGLGVMDLFQKRLDTARARLSEAQHIFRDVGNRTGVLMTLGNLGMVASDQRQFAEAQQLYADALELAAEIGDRRLRAALLDNLGDVATQLGEADEAARSFGESLRLALEAGAKNAALLALAGIARLRARAGAREEALELLGLIAAHLACDDETRQRADPLLEELRQTAPAEVVEAALARGQALPLDVVAERYVV